MPASPRASSRPGRRWRRFAAVTTAVCALAALGAGPAQALDLRGGDGSLLENPLDQAAALAEAATADTTSDLTTVTQSTAPVVESLPQTLAPVLDATAQTAAPLAATVEQTVAAVAATTEQVLAPTLETAQQVVAPVLATADETLASDAVPVPASPRHDDAPPHSQPEQAAVPSNRAGGTSTPLSPPADRAAPTLSSTSGDMAAPSRSESPAHARGAHREAAETGIARPRLGLDTAWTVRSEDSVTARAARPDRPLPPLPLDGFSGSDGLGSPLAPTVLVLAALLMSFALVPPAARARLVPLAAARLLPADARFRLARPG